MARYAIGDVQGCMASLERLLALIEYTPGRDELWLVGDLVNRGPRSLDVLRWARAQGDAIVTVIGNHDLHLLARAAGVSPEKKRDTLDDVLAAPDRDELLDWLRARPLAHVADGFAMVHAGIHPRWTIDDLRARAAEIEHELRAPSWRAFLAHVPGPVLPWLPRLVSGERWRAILAYLIRVRTCFPDGRADPGEREPRQVARRHRRPPATCRGSRSPRPRGRRTPCCSATGRRSGSTSARTTSPSTPAACGGACSPRCACPIGRCSR